MIRAFSPYYVSVPIDFPTTTTSVTLGLFVWEGDKTIDQPANTQYRVEKNVPNTTTTNLDFDISKLIQDFLFGKPLNSFTTTGLLDQRAANTVWMKYVVTYNDPVETIPDIEFTDFATRGYGYYLEGANPPTPNHLLINTNRMLPNVTDTKHFIIPIRATDAASITITPDAGVPTVIPVSILEDSNEQIQNLVLNLDDFNTAKSLTIDYVSDSIYLEFETECKYDPKHVIFMNQFGAYESIYFFKQKLDDINVTDKEWKNNVVTAGVYDTELAQRKRFDVVGTEFTRLNTGWVEEDYNDTIRQLLLTEEVYLFENRLIPIKIQTKQLQYKTRLVDSLINYTIVFDYAYDLINDV